MYTSLSVCYIQLHKHTSTPLDPADSQPGRAIRKGTHRARPPCPASPRRRASGPGTPAPPPCNPPEHRPPRACRRRPARPQRQHPGILSPVNMTHSTVGAQAATPVAGRTLTSTADMKSDTSSVRTRRLRCGRSSPRTRPGVRSQTGSSCAARSHPNLTGLGPGPPACPAACRCVGHRRALPGSLKTPHAWCAASAAQAARVLRSRRGSPTARCSERVAHPPQQKPLPAM